MDGRGAISKQALEAQHGMMQSGRAEEGEVAIGEQRGSRCEHPGEALGDDGLLHLVDRVLQRDGPELGWVRGSRLLGQQHER